MRLPELVRPLVFEAARHVYRLAREPDYRSYCRLDACLGNLPRFVPCSVSVHGWDLHVPDAASFLSAYREIFVEGIYRFCSRTSAPSVLDLGANIGLSVLFVKRLFPAARITAYEPDPRIFACLRRNVHGNGFADVNLVNGAVWSRSGTLRFHSEGGDGGRVAAPGDEGVVEVEAVDVREVLRGGPYDFVKMDIEGAEEEVFPACRGLLADIGCVFVEYHSAPGRRQCLGEIVSLLVDAGFRVHVHSVAPTPSPLLSAGTRAGFDMQLNVFAYREPR